MSETTEPAKGEMQFQAKSNCKSCYGRGFLDRTWPVGKTKDGKKEMMHNKTLCHCATEIKRPEPDECVVPKVSKDVLDDPNGVMILKKKEYASVAVPIMEEANGKDNV